MPPGLQRRFYLLVLQALAVLVFRQQSPDFRAADPESDTKTVDLLREINQLAIDIRESAGRF